MISPFTLPGTKVVCVMTQANDLLPLLTVGKTYTVYRIVMAVNGPGVFLVETLPQHLKKQFLWRYVKRGDFRRRLVSYDLEYFAYPALPECLTSLLNVAPAPAPENARVS